MRLAQTTRRRSRAFVADELHQPKLYAKVQAYVFYVLRKTSMAAWKDGLEDWKALGVLSVTMTSAVLTFACVVSICIQRRVLLPKSKAEFTTLWGLVGFSLVIFNYHTLLAGGKWSRFEREFERRPRMNGVFEAAAVWASVILIIAVSEWTGSIAWKLPPFG